MRFYHAHEIFMKTGRLPIAGVPRRSGLSRVAH